MKDLSTLTSFHRSQLEAERPFIWLYELETTDDPPQRHRYTNFDQRVYFGESSTGARLQYSPAPVVHSDIEEDGEGGLPTITITFANTGTIMAQTIDAADGFVGQPFRISLVSSLELNNPSAAIIQDGEVISATIERDSVAFKVSAFNLFQLEYPPFIYARRRCRFIFGSSECGYNVSATGAGFSTCTKTIDACRERGADEELRSIARLHPERFGGFPGIPRVAK